MGHILNHVMTLKDKRLGGGGKRSRHAAKLWGRDRAMLEKRIALQEAQFWLLCDIFSVHKLCFPGSNTMEVENILDDSY